MKQFSEVSNLINKFGYRFSRRNFTFKIDSDFIIFFVIFKVPLYNGNAGEEVAKTIRSCLNEYYNDWKWDIDSDYFQITNK